MKPMRALSVWVHRSRTRLQAPLLWAVLATSVGLIGGLAAGAGCDESPEGTLALHWSINGAPAATGCPAASVSRLRVLTGRMGQEPDEDPANPAGPYVDFECGLGEAEFPLPEGLYRIRIVALDDLGNVRSQVVERLGVEVVHGAVTRLPGNPDIEPPIDIVVPVCGNGVAEPGEWCDATDLGGLDCGALGYDGGSLVCRADCTLEESGCTRCGDGVTDTGSGEQCDGSALAGATCESLGFFGGSLACGPDCQFLLTGCMGCGNGVLEAGEACDDGNRDGGDGCDPACRLERAAVQVLWSPETADGTPTDCASLGVAEVTVRLRVAGQGVTAAEANAPCTGGPAVFADLPYGLYAVGLVGRDAGGAPRASGQSPVLDLSTPTPVRITVALVAD